MNSDESKPVATCMETAIARSSGNKAQAWDGQTQYIVQEREDLGFRVWVIREEEVIMNPVYRVRLDLDMLLKNTTITTKQKIWYCV